MLEIACFNSSSAFFAAQAGADRIELCADYVVGGITPPLSSFQRARQLTRIPINVMIRPRAGDFTYSKEEFEKMKAEILLFKPFASGFVFGILELDERVDEARNRELVELAAPLPCTFHRAVDEVEDMDAAVGSIISCGFRSILTSGGAKTAVEGAETVAKLQKKYAAEIVFILGGGVRSTNLEELKNHGAWWLHSAAITRPGEDVDDAEVKKMQQILHPNSWVPI